MSKEVIITSVISVVVPVIISVFTCFIYIGRKFERLDRLEDEYKKINEEISEIGEKINKLFQSMSAMDEKVNRLDKDMPVMDGKINKLFQDMSAVEEFKTNTQKFIDSKIYKAGSPLVLTDYGKKLIKDSGFESIFEREKDELVLKLEQKRPKTKYDVQEKARELMNELTEYPAFQVIKAFAFENGHDYNQILRAGAIPLRDYFLEKHQEISAS